MGRRRRSQGEPNIAGVEVRPLAAAAGGPQRRRVSVRVDNPTNAPLYVWASRRAYDYDSSTNVLTVYLTENTPPLPPDIEIVSNHPRTPEQVEVSPGSQGSVEVEIPAVIRRRVPGDGLGMHFVEEPIGQIDRVDLHLQYATEPFRPTASGESPEEHRARLQAHGQVVNTTITPTEVKEQ